MRLTICLLVIALLSVSTFAAKKALVCPPLVKLTDFKPNQSVFKDAKRNAPIQIKTTDDVVKYFGKEQAKAIGKKVDLKHQTILVFAWRGSGQDQLQYTILKSNPPQYDFYITPGRTRDLRPHVHVYAVREDIKWKAR